MNKTLVFATLLATGIAASAQEVETPKVEIGANYTYERVNPTGIFSSYNSNGGSGYVEYNLNRYFGVVADLGGTYTGTVHGVAIDSTSFQYLFGPRVNFRHSRFTPYVQTLFGGERLGNGFAGGSGNAFLNSSQNNFAAAFGGGIDITLTKHIAVKPVQVEYLLAEVSPNGSNVRFAQNNLRYSAGVVFRFGSK